MKRFDKATRCVRAALLAIGLATCPLAHGAPPRILVQAPHGGVGDTITKDRAARACGSVYEAAVKGGRISLTPAFGD